MIQHERRRKGWRWYWFHFRNRPLPVTVHLDDKSLEGDNTPPLAWQTLPAPPVLGDGREQEQELKKD